MNSVVEQLSEELRQQVIIWLYLLSWLALMIWIHTPSAQSSRQYTAQQKRLNLTISVLV